MAMETGWMLGNGRRSLELPCFGVWWFTSPGHADVTTRIVTRKALVVWYHVTVIREGRLHDGVGSFSDNSFYQEKTCGMDCGSDSL